MRRVLRAVPFTIAALVVLGFGIAFAAHFAGHSVHTRGVSPTSDVSPTTDVCTTIRNWPPGSPCDPRTAGAPVQTPGMPALKPHFTESDVRAYIAQHPFLLARTLDGKAAPISKVQFVTSAQAEAIFQEPTGAAPNDMVCIVWFAGSLLPSVNGPPVFGTPTPGPTPTPTIASSAAEVFDVTTGNLLEATI